MDTSTAKEFLDKSTKDYEKSGEDFYLSYMIKDQKKLQDLKHQEDNIDIYVSSNVFNDTCQIRNFINQAIKYGTYGWPMSPYKEDHSFSDPLPTAEKVHEDWRDAIRDFAKAVMPVFNGLFMNTSVDFDKCYDHIKDDKVLRVLNILKFASNFRTEEEQKLADEQNNYAMELTKKLLKKLKDEEDESEQN
jgi:hypothetical protein